MTFVISNENVLLYLYLIAFQANHLLRDQNIFDMKDLSKEECFDLLRTNYIGRLGYIIEKETEIIPITFYFDEKQEAIISYSGTGQKITSMRKNPMVSFQVDEITTLKQWKSTLFYGTFEELSQIDAKKALHIFSEGVKELILKKENKDLNYITEFSSKTRNPNESVIYRISIKKIKGKKRTG